MPIADFKIILYTDQTALLYDVPGQTMVLGVGSLHKHAQNLFGSDYAIIKTESGNTFSIGRGRVIDKDAGEDFALPHLPLHVTFGEPLEFPAVKTTDPVKSVLLRNRLRDPQDRGDLRVDESSPFVALVQELALLSGAGRAR